MVRFFPLTFCLCAGFVVRSPLSHRLQQKSSSELYYFDDVSRTHHEDEWDPSSAREAYRYTQAKQEAMKRFFGFDAEQAGGLTNKEVRRKMKQWMIDTAVIGKIEGNELYDASIGMSICRNRSMAGCLAKIWKLLAKFERDDAAAPDNQNTVYMITFPDCDKLYNYGDLATLKKAVEISNEMLLLSENEDTPTLATFHPNFENSPRMFSPDRHSPFPSIGIEFKRKDNNDPIICSALQRKIDAGDIYGIEEIADDDFSPIFNDERRQLEVLFNSASDGSTNVGISTKEVISITKTWMSENREVVFSMIEREDNEALKYIDTIDNERWVVSEATRPEALYHELWSVISQLGEEKGKSAVFISTKFSAFNAPQWRKVAITINAALKKFGDARMFVEMFHPEYAFEENNQYRKSPFAMIQICNVSKR